MGLEPTHSEWKRVDMHPGRPVEEVEDFVEITVNFKLRSYALYRGPVFTSSVLPDTGATAAPSDVTWIKDTNEFKTDIHSVTAESVDQLIADLGDSSDSLLLAGSRYGFLLNSRNTHHIVQFVMRALNRSGVGALSDTIWFGPRVSPWEDGFDIQLGYVLI